MVSPSSSDADWKHDEKNDHVVEVSVNDVDTAAQIVAGASEALDPREAERIKKKIDRHILPLMCTLYWIQFMDKTTLGSSAILGIRESTHLSTNQYNWLGTIFYLSYLVFEFPQNLCLQRFPVGRWMSINIFVWAVALCCHAACKNFAGLFVVRLILGMCEGSITAGFMIVSSMFYTRKEQTLRVGYWFLMNGTAQIISGFISFGTLHIKTGTFEPWQWYAHDNHGFNHSYYGDFLLVSLTYTSYTATRPNHPGQRPSRELRHENQTGVENKHFKKEQMIEALTDPKTWLFALFAALDNIPNSLTNQRTIIVSSFGFSNLQTTLLSCVDGFVEIVTIWTGVIIASRIPNSRAYVGAIYMLPNVLGVFLVNFLPWSNKIGLLFSVWITGVGTTGFVLSLSWVSAVVSGHTKKITVNAIMLSAYCIGNSAGPFMWQAKYKPRNHIPWIIIGICYVCCMSLLLTIRFLLSRENKRRNTESTDDAYGDVYIERLTSDGKKEMIKVDKEFLDLTDIQNRDFRYVL
ncbi:related to permease of the major facilitator superfamily [Armillaria ostoyae]|uniref:Related to permease of the major facilitator superfamily n=1 Tax=Armillaria ostoyae TaxID=47428 RepID=A0A284R724_ARMOS|nr:related to permease of the major facilitator superfamily [Armillaria ostoyae]